MASLFQIQSVANSRKWAPVKDAKANHVVAQPAAMTALLAEKKN
jgi:hypothetical protein